MRGRFHFSSGMANRFIVTVFINHELKHDGNSTKSLLSRLALVSRTTGPIPTQALRTGFGEGASSRLRFGRSMSICVCMLCTGDEGRSFDDARLPIIHVRSARVLRRAAYTYRDEKRGPREHTINVQTRCIRVKIRPNSYVQKVLHPYWPNLTQKLALLWSRQRNSLRNVRKLRILHLGAHSWTFLTMARLPRKRPTALCRFHPAAQIS
jgi:hypothetical protein